MAIRNTARTPKYDGTSTGEWNAPDFSNYVAGYYKNHPDVSENEVNTVDEASVAMRRWIASLSLLGKSDADTFDDLIFFPVVNPGSMNLNRNALIAVVGGRGGQADISDEQLTSARKKAYSLLVKEFDYNSDEVPSEYKTEKAMDRIWEAVSEMKENLEEL